MSTKYSVYFELVAQKKYIKDFIKEYSENKWDITQRAIESMCSNPEMGIQSEKIETISENQNQITAKLFFAVAGTQISPKKSGCRAILLIDKKIFKVRILLVYKKKHVKGNETVWWKKEIENYYGNI